MNIRMSLSALTAVATLTVASLTSTSQDSAPGFASQDSRPAQDRPAAQAADQETVDLRPVTVIAVRHCEKGKDDPRDPGLAEAGTARAQQLSKLLAHSGVTHVYATGYRRTQDSIAPLAAAAGLEVITYDARAIANFAESLAELPPGSVAVVAGHSNTTPDLVFALGGEVTDLVAMQGMQLIEEDQYDRLFIVNLPATSAPVTTLEMRYGE